jgi:hypothetical protein
VRSGSASAGPSLEEYGKREALEILDVSELVAAQRQNVEGSARDLVTPLERIYLPQDASIRSRIGV